MTKVLHYADYLRPDSAVVFSYADFCGACRQRLGGPTNSSLIDRLYQPEQLEAKNDTPTFVALRLDDGAEYMHWMFCPWCGTRFDDEWWKDRPIQNERPIDHYDHPGSHKGDVHEFVGAMEGHCFGSSDPSYICWCQPEITPGLLGCTIRHTVMPPPELVRFSAP